MSNFMQFYTEFSPEMQEDIEELNEQYLKLTKSYNAEAGNYHASMACYIMHQSEQLKLLNHFNVVHHTHYSRFTPNLIIERSYFTI